MDGLQQVHEERYAADLTALAECVARGVSDQTVFQLAGECGIDRRDLAQIMRFKQEATK